MSRVLIINADDLGEPKFSDAILDGLSRGLVTSSTLLIGRGSARRSLHSAQAIGASIGLHINLTAGRPVCDPDLIPTLVTTAGDFLGKDSCEERLAAGEVDPHDVRTECEAQLERFRGYAGAYPVHVDGHHHVQSRPTVAKQLGPLCDARGIRRMRLPLEDSQHFAHLEPARRRWAEQLVADAQQAAPIYQESGLRWPNFVGIGYGWSDATEDRLLRRLEQLPDGVSEYMVHILRPGELPDDDPASGREIEWQLLASSAFRDALERFEIRLGSYRDL